MAREISSVDKFILEHKKQYINYCEVVIKPNGIVEYAIPSHLYKLEALWGVPEEEWYDGGPHRFELMSKMPISCSPVHWLCGDLRCIVCWYNGVLLPLNYTKKSLYTLKKLIDTGCISRACDIEITIENVIETARQNMDTFNQLLAEKQAKQSEVFNFIHK